MIPFNIYLVVSSHWPTDQDVSSHDLAWGIVSTQTCFPSVDPPSYDNGTELHPSQCSNGASSSKREQVSPPSLADFYVMRKDIQNQFGQSIGSNNRKTIGFDATLLVVWRLRLGCGMPMFVLQSSLIKDRFFIFFRHSTLWSVTQLKKFPEAGEHTGAIDPKTLQKYIWPFIEAIVKLVPYVVSVMHDCFHFYLVLFLLKIFRFY